MWRAASTLAKGRPTANRSLISFYRFQPKVKDQHPVASLWERCKATVPDHHSNTDMSPHPEILATNPSSIGDYQPSYDASLTSFRPEDGFAEADTFMAPGESSLQDLIHQCPPGSLLLGQWFEAKKLLIELIDATHVDQADALLKRMLLEIEHSPSDRLHPNKKLPPHAFNKLLFAHRKQPERAQKIFDWMQETSQQFYPACPYPDVVSYNNLLKAWGSSSHSRTARLMDLFHSMLNSNNKNNIPSPDGYTYNIVMSSLAQRAHVEYGIAKTVEDLLLQFSERHLQHPLEMTEGPSNMTFNIVIKAWSNSGDERGPHRALEVFELMKKLYLEGHGKLRPDVVSLVSLMNAYAKRGDAEKAEQLLREHTTTTNNRDNVMIEGDLSNAYNCLITAYKNAGLPNSGTEAERIFREMERPDDGSLMMVLHAHVMSGHEDSGPRAEAILEEYVDQYLSFGEQSLTPPSRLHFHSVMDAWIRCSNGSHSDQEIADKLLAIKERMEQLADEWKLNVAPNAATYNYVIGRWAVRDADKGLELLQEAESRDIIPYHQDYNNMIRQVFIMKDGLVTAEAILDRMKKNGVDNRTAYNLVMVKLAGKLRYAGSKERIAIRQKLLKMLDEMHHRYYELDNHYMRPTIGTYCAVLSALSKHPIMPNTTPLIHNMYVEMKKLHANAKEPTQNLQIGAYNALLNTLSEVASREAAGLANHIFHEMMDEKSPVKPDATCMAMVIKTHAKAPTSALTQSAQDMYMALTKDFVEGKTSIYPHVSGATVIMHGWSRCQRDFAVDEAKKLIQFCKESKIIPMNVQLIMAYLSVLARNGNNHGEEAEEFLESIDSDSVDTAMWNSVIRVWSRSSRADRATKALACLEKMKKGGESTSPNADSYFGIINTAAFCIATDEEKAAGLAVVNEARQDLQASPSLQPNENTYIELIRAYSQLIDDLDERAVPVRAVFDECKANQGASQRLLRALEHALAKTDYDAAVNEGDAK